MDRFVDIEQFHTIGFIILFIVILCFALLLAHWEQKE